MTQLPGLDCNQVVELVSDYLEGALDAATAQRVRQHLAECPGCDTYVEQIGKTVRSLGEVPTGTLTPQAQDELMSAFRDFHLAR